MGTERALIARLLVLGLLAGAGVASGQSPRATPPAERPTALDGPAPSAASGRLERLLAEGQPLLRRYGYAAVFVAVLVEGFGIPAPGQTLLMVGAVEAARGHLPLGTLLVVAGVAAFAGTSIGYAIGRWGGRALLARARGIERRLQRIEAAFARYGGGVVAGGRFFDGLRQLSGIAAGLLGMPWWRFAAFNALGTTLWIGLWGGGMYVLSEHTHALFLALRRFEPWIVALATAGVIGAAVYLWRGRRRRTARDGA